jgi:hypothetical protein
VTMETIVSWSLWMIIPLGILGSLLHFLFDWTKHNRLVMFFAAVNESYWEHIKIAVWPVFFLQVALFAFGGYQLSAFLPAATVALYSLPISMIGLVFGYKMITKRNILWLDIGIFFVVIALGQTLFVLVLQELEAGAVTVGLSLVFLAGLVAAFLRYTVRPPEETDIFMDPTNKGYGLRAHPDLKQQSSKSEIK